MDKQIIKGKWDEFKGEARKFWGDLTDNELEQTKGNVTAIGGLLRQKYGEAKDDVKTRFDGLVERFGDKASDTTENIKQSLSDTDKDAPTGDRH